MAKRKTGLGFQALFEGAPADESDNKQESKAPKNVTPQFDLDTKTLSRLEAAQSFVSWLIGQEVSQQMLIEAALKITLDELDAKGKESQLAKQIANGLESKS